MIRIGTIGRLMKADSAWVGLPMVLGWVLLCCVACGPHKTSINNVVIDKETILKHGEPYTGEVWSEDGRSYCLTSRNGELTKFVMYHLNRQEAVRIDNLSDEFTVYDETGKEMNIDSFAVQYENLVATLHELFPKDSIK